MDKNSADYEDQGDWSDYEKSEEINIHLLDTNNENNISKILFFTKKKKN